VDNDKLMMTVAVLGGTGKEGSGLALRWANSGYHVIIGSRDAERAQTKATELNELINGNIEGLSNQDATTKADIIVLTVPYDAHKATLESVRNEVQGKILVDVTVPMQPPDIRKVYVPTGHAASLEAQALLGDGVKVVSAFQNVSASHLKKLDHEMACDVLVTGDDDAAKTHTIHLVEAAGMRGIDAGPLVNAVAAEALTPVLMYINKKYAVKGAGIHITGIATEE
jgi:8-hydroxy-5-deazaflavin:NADPH oxidoreductase